MCLNEDMTTMMNHLTDHRPLSEHDGPDLHQTDPTQPCFMCWCYGCGGRTDEPRIEHAPGVEQHHGDPSHRWCFE